MRQVIEEMDKFRKDFYTILTDPKAEHDLANFWLRKTKKPVLSVLLVEKKGIVKLYRGTNMEVSMPTGSLCAERNVIGSALADDPTLMRQDIKVIAVYSVNMSASNASQSANAASEETRGQRSDSLPQEPLGALEAIVENVVASPSTRCYPCKDEGSPEPPLSIAIISEDAHATSSAPSYAKSPLTGQKRKIFRMTSTTIKDVEAEETSQEMAVVPPSIDMTSPGKSGSVLRSAKKKTDEVSSADVGGIKSKKGRKKSIPFSSPLGLQSTAATSLDKESALINSIVPTMTTVYVEENDMNPLKPCGACNEWLKKIAEVNPHMKVITFTDANCTGIYIEHIND